MGQRFASDLLKQRHETKFIGLFVGTTARGSGLVTAGRGLLALARADAVRHGHITRGH